jgi:hypothetical protein
MIALFIMVPSLASSVGILVRWALDRIRVAGFSIKRKAISGQTAWMAKGQKRKWKFDCFWSTKRFTVVYC